MPSLDTFEDFEAIPSSTDELSNSSDLEEESNPNNVIPFSNYAALSQCNLLFSKDHNLTCKVWVHISLKLMDMLEYRRWVLGDYSKTILLIRIRTIKSHPYL